jgi:hypothetical protein
VQTLSSEEAARQLLLEECRSKPHERIFYGELSFTYRELGMVLEGVTPSVFDRDRLNLLRSYAEKMVKSLKKVLEG